MNDGLTGQLNQRQGDFLESSQQPFGGGTIGLLLWITGVQTGQALLFNCQRTASHKFSQGQNTQRQGQKPHQAGEMIFSVQVDRSQPQRSAFEPGKEPFDSGGPSIGQNGLGQGKLVCRDIEDIQTSAHRPELGFNGDLVTAQMELITYFFLSPGRAILILTNLSLANLAFVGHLQQLSHAALLQNGLDLGWQGGQFLILRLTPGGGWGQSHQFFFGSLQPALQAPISPVGQARRVDDQHPVSPFNHLVSHPLGLRTADFIALGDQPPRLLLIWLLIDIDQFLIFSQSRHRYSPANSASNSVCAPFKLKGGR